MWSRHWRAFHGNLSSRNCGILRILYKKKKHTGLIQSKYAWSLNECNSSFARPELDWQWFRLGGEQAARGVKTFRRAVCGGTGKGLTSELRGFQEGGVKGRIVGFSCFLFSLLLRWVVIFLCVRAGWWNSKSKSIKRNDCAQRPRCHVAPSI